MFNQFPFGLGNVFNLTSFTSFTSFTGNNGFNIFSSINGVYGTNGMNNFLNENNINALNELEGILTNILNDIDIKELSKKYNVAISNLKNEKLEEDCNFVKFDRFEDMYLLSIDLTGIDLRELSIKYDPGIINITLKRSEYNAVTGYGMVKKNYSKVFDEIEDIDTTHVLKSIDNGILSMRMPKKYVLEKGDNVVEVNDYIVEKTEETEVVKTTE